MKISDSIAGGMLNLSISEKKVFSWNILC